MTDDAIERAAQALAAAWRGGAAIPLPAPALRPKTRQAAYAIQDRMAVLLGQPTVGWKVGAANAAVQRRDGHDGPIVGRLIASTVFDSPAQLPAGRFAGGNLECEIAFRVARDLPARVASYTADELASVASVHFAFEVTGTRYRRGEGEAAPGTHDIIADNGGGGAFVFGEGHADWRGMRFQEMQVDLRIDGGALVENFFGATRSDPLAVLTETVNDLGQRGLGLRAGDTVSTGSLTVPLPIGAGSAAVARFGDEAELRLSLV